MVTRIRAPIGTDTALLLAIAVSAAGLADLDRSARALTILKAALIDR